MAVYRGLSGVNREIKRQWRGVGGVNREVTEQWRGISGVNRPVMKRAYQVTNFNVDTSFGAQPPHGFTMWDSKGNWTYGVSTPGIFVNVGYATNLPKKYANSSFYISGREPNAWTQVLIKPSYALLPTNHICYSRVEILTTSSVVYKMQFGFFVSVESAPIFIPPASNTWYMMSERKVGDASSNRSAGVINIIKDVYGSTSMYDTVMVDGAMNIDLTACFGAGNEPTQEWCDANIPFFVGTQTIYY